MKNEILKILLKPRESRSLWELMLLIQFYDTCSAQEFKYAWGIEYQFKKNEV